MEIDLNDAPINDMQEVIFNTVAPLGAGEGDFLEIIDLAQNVAEEVIQPVQQVQGVDLNDPPQQILQQNIDDMGIPHLNLPIEPIIDDEEIPFDMLMD